MTLRGWLLLLVGLTSAYTVSDAQADDGPDFGTQVIPVLTKVGCNSAACHGAAIGRGGLKLSLFGYDSESDRESLLFEYRGRRINLGKADRSLVLRKASRQIRHGGGRRLPIDSEGFEVLREWIASGAQPSTGRLLEKLEISPRQKLVTDLAGSFQVRVMATFSDGTTSDVTRWSLFESNDKQVLQVDATGSVSVLRRGQSSLMVRFLDHVDRVIVTAPLESVGDDVTQVKGPPRFNFIDDHVNRTLARLQMDHSAQTDDATFLRRVYLDLTGSLPTPGQQREFSADRRLDKRTHLVDELLRSEAFVNHWSYIWGDLLQIESRRLGQSGAKAFHKWLKQQIAGKTPLDEMARTLVLATGDGNVDGAANFHRVPNDAREQAEFVSRVFLGVRLQCANCHNHPLDRWTQDDYHGLAAVFAKMNRNQVVSVTDRGEVIHPRTKQAAVPRIPGTRFVSTSTDPRAELADWMTGPRNPYFARAAVNRIWRQLMGRGLVEPVDDHRASNPATHPELLNALATEFVDNKYDLRFLIKSIVSSAAYQRSSLVTGNNVSDDRFYARALVRRLSPVVMVDAVASVTGVPEDFGALPPGTKAIELGDSRINSRPLDLLGRCDRAGGCAETEAETIASLPLTLHVINGDWINAKLDHPEGNFALLFRKEAAIDETVKQIYQLAYCRQPDDDELAHWTGVFSGLQGHKKTQALKDFCWAVLNSTEFCTNH